MLPFEAEGYICNHCDRLHYEKEDAIDCCCDISQFQGYICRACGNRFEDKKKAEKCCDPKTSERGYMFIQRLLERNGQLRLFA